ncbi:MAG TPA: alkaline phosphatase family protein [Tepidisphaeraceae bacterium]|jgi:acid phosphatase|nr:alkaline phosphatase family protein [Tepidisphaeraceae bacterium]
MRIWRALCCALALGTGTFSFAAPPAYDHVVVVIEENHSFSQVIGSASAPYINNTLVAGGSSFKNMYAITHPSQPNYLHFFSGASQGVTNDNPPATWPFSGSTSNLGGALIMAGKTFVGYSESLPSVGSNVASFTTADGDYMRKHNPWVNWQSASADGTNFLLPSSVNEQFTHFPSDYSTLPKVSIVVPNQMHDMHDGTVAQGDTWLQNNLGAYATWAKTHNSLLILTFDEDESASRNRIPTVFYGANVARGTNNATWTLHNVLRTIEDTYGVGHSGAAADVKPIVGSFTNDWTQAVRSFQQGVNGYTSAHDTYFDGTAPHTSTQHGSDTQIVVDGSPNQQGLIRFDNLVGNSASQVSLGTKVLSAKLRIYTGTGTNDLSANNFGLYTMLRSWNDTDTYDSLDSGITLGTEASALPTFTALPNKTGVYVVFDVTDTVQSWVDGSATNFGWLMKIQSGSDGWRFSSSDNATTGDRPYLEIVVPEPAGAVVMMFALSHLARRPRRECESPCA